MPLVRRALQSGILALLSSVVGAQAATGTVFGFDGQPVRRIGGGARRGQGGATGFRVLQEHDLLSLAPTNLLRHRGDDKRSGRRASGLLPRGLPATDRIENAVVRSP